MEIEEKIEILKSVFFGEESWESMKHRAKIMNILMPKKEFREIKKAKRKMSK